MEKAKKPNKNRSFLRWSSKNVKNKKKNGFLAKIAWHYLYQEGRNKTRIFVHTICFGQNIFSDQNSANQEKLLK